MRMLLIDVNLVYSVYYKLSMEKKIIITILTILLQVVIGIPKATAQSYNEIQTANMQKLSEYTQQNYDYITNLMKELGDRYQNTPVEKREELLHSIINEADSISIDKFCDVQYRYIFVFGVDNDNKLGLKMPCLNKIAYLFELRGCNLMAKNFYEQSLSIVPQNADALAGLKRIKKDKRKIQWNNLINNAQTIGQALTILGSSMEQNNSDSSYDEGNNSHSSSKKGKTSKSNSSSGCKHCGGTGHCPYCNGDGFNYVAGNPVQCTACKGHIGRCKWCNK